jgi:FSR family fosmidomycin resistance protein-like MFS transporter
MPLGIIADKLNRNYLFAISGCVLIGFAYGLVHIPIAAVVIIGIGNAMFHIGGGIDVLNISEKKLGALGVFVSPGAFGVYYGTMFGRGSNFSIISIPYSSLTYCPLLRIVFTDKLLWLPKKLS